jgi:hypothetical protein
MQPTVLLARRLWLLRRRATLSTSRLDAKLTAAASSGYQELVISPKFKVTAKSRRNIIVNQKDFGFYMVRWPKCNSTQHRQLTAG